MQHFIRRVAPMYVPCSVLLYMSMLYLVKNFYEGFYMHDLIVGLASLFGVIICFRFIWNAPDLEKEDK